MNSNVDAGRSMARDAAAGLSGVLGAPRLLSEREAQEWALEQLPPFSKTGDQWAETSKRASDEASRSYQDVRPLLPKISGAFTD